MSRCPNYHKNHLCLQEYSSLFIPDDWDISQSNRNNRILVDWWEESLHWACPLFKSDLYQGQAMYSFVVFILLILYFFIYICSNVVIKYERQELLLIYNITSYITEQNRLVKWGLMDIRSHRKRVRLPGVYEKTCGEPSAHSQHRAKIKINKVK